MSQTPLSQRSRASEYEAPTLDKTIAKLRGRASGAGSELALVCDMRFAAWENAVLGQIETGVFLG